VTIWQSNRDVRRDAGAEVDEFADATGHDSGTGSDEPFRTRIVLREKDAELQVGGWVGPESRTRFAACFASVCNAARPRVVVDFGDVTGWEPGTFDMVTDAVRTCRRSGTDVSFVHAPPELAARLDR
jgi:hypothetical protein